MATLKEKAQQAYEMHMKAYENWPHGKIKNYYVPDDLDDGDIVVSYADGMYFHYRFTQKGELIFW